MDEDTDSCERFKIMERKLYWCIMTPGGVLTDVFGVLFFFSSRRRHTRLQGDWSSDVCSSDLVLKDGIVVAAAGAERAALADDADVASLSGDLPVHTWMSVSNASTAADQTRAGAPGLFGIGGIPAVTGQGVGVAVIDSGVNPHPAIANRIVANVSLVTGDPSYLDAFGHGTHVAGIIAGNTSAASGVTTLYNGGIAPGANIINVRELGADGTGLTSDVIARIDWAIDNRARYNIRIINLSLGHPVTEPA